MKKIVCIVLCVCLLASACTICAYGASGAAQPAVYTEGGVTNEYPLVVVRGMDFTKGLKYHAGQEDERDVNVLANLSFGGVMRALARTFAAFITRGKNGAVDELIAFAATLFEGYACDENGDPADPEISSRSYPQSVSHYPEIWQDATGHEEGLVHSAVDRYGGDNVYYLRYDWRLDTLENAARLSSLIDTAMAEHGCDKVDLVCCSMGGILTLTYLNYYGASHIDSLVSASSTMYGTDVTTDLLLGKVGFDEDAAYRYLKHHLAKFGLLVDALYKTGVIKGVCRFLNRFAEEYKQKIYDGVLTPVFGSMPAMWELVQNEYYEDAKAYIFGDSGAYAGMLAKTDKIQREVVARNTEILDRAMASGVKFGVLAGYDTPLVPAYASAALQGDGTLETRMMSFGALVSEVGSFLSEEELSQGDARYVSADRCINASTAVYRDLTWFVKDSVHVACGYHSDYTYLVFSILETKTQPTVTTWEKYPQFMQADENENLTPLTAAKGRWD